MIQPVSETPAGAVFSVDLWLGSDATQRPRDQTSARTSLKPDPGGEISLRSNFFSFLKVLQGGVFFSHHQSRISINISVNEEIPVPVSLYR